MGSNKAFGKGYAAGRKTAIYDRKSTVIDDISDGLGGHPYYKPPKDQTEEWKEGYRQGKKDGKK
ncbi:hypothetical protein KA005_05530 [bacterium]|nr:hypothetical protein [bacterium]